MNVIIQTWQSHPQLFDFLLYLLFFGAVARAALANHFPGQPGKAVAVAIGLTLAAALTKAQHTLGWSIDKLGPAAVFLIGLVLFITAYKLLSTTGAPPLLSALGASLLIPVVAHAAAPQLTRNITQKHPTAALIGTAGLLGLLWTFTLRHANRPRPGKTLTRYGLLPTPQTLKKQEKNTKQQLQRKTKKAANQEQKAGTELHRARDLLARKGLNQQTRPKLIEYCTRARQRTAKLAEQQKNLVSLDQATRNLEKHRLSRAAAAKLNQLTPEQQKLIKQAALAERKRLRVEEELERLQIEVERHTRAVNESLRKCIECLTVWNAPGAAGWLNQAIQEHANAKRLEHRILALQKKLMALLQLQEKEIARAA